MHVTPSALRRSRRSHPAPKPARCAEPHTSSFRLAVEDRDALLALVEQALRDGASVRATLKGAVCDVVRQTKAQGWPPEVVIVALKDVVLSAARESGAATTSAPPVPSATRARLLEQVVRWCVDEYYA